MKNAPILDGDKSCKQCASDNLHDFNGELAIHFPGIANLDKPVVFVFPKLRACLDCGFVGFFLPDAEKEQLNDSDSLAQSGTRGE